MRIVPRRSPPRRRRLGVLWVAGVVLAWVLCAGSAAAGPLSDPVVFCRLPVGRVPPGPLSGGMLPGDYGSGATLSLLRPDGSTTELTPEFASACDPDVSFDAQRILFAGQKRAGDPWNIWEMQADGTGLRQITHETLDCRNPIYLSTFYTITSAEPWYTILFVRIDEVANETATAPGTSLYTVRLDGSELRRISFHPGNDRTPFLLRDGRVLFAGWRLPPEWGETPGRVGLFGIQTDGIDYASFGGDQGKRIQHMPSVTTDATVVFVEADSLEWDGSGSLAALDRSRPHHSYRSLTDPGAGLFHSPSPLPDGSLLVSHRSREGAEPFRLVRFSPQEGVLETVHEEAGDHILHAKVVAPRPEPDGRSSTVQPDSPTGKLFCLDVYESDPALSTLERGSARRIRVLEGVPSARVAPAPADTGDSPAAPATGLSRRLLGEAPVEEDGSFHIDLPADLPVQLQLLDEDRLALATCDWIWVKPREYRGCIGCHEDPELTPPNRFVQAVARPATQLTLPVERRRVVTFRDEVLPLLGSRCQRCHQDGESGLALGSLAGSDGARAAYRALLGGPGPSGDPRERYVEPGAARNSPLVWRLLGRDTSRSWDRDTRPLQEVPRDHVDLLSPEERQVFIEWIDLGAPWDFPRDSAPGSVEGASR